MKLISKYIVQQIAVAVAGATIGMLVIFILKHLLKVPLSKPILSIIAFAISAIFVVVLIPKAYKLPFGKISISQYLNKLGVYIPVNWGKHLLLGILTAIVLLSGLLVGSLLTGKYAFDSTNINLGQILFSLTPGVWEEVCFRGIIMLVLLNATKSLKKAFIWQIIIFGICHIKDIDLLGIIDAFSVIIIAIAFTYLAIKTKSLFSAIITHFLYDSFLYVVQIPDGIYSGFTDNALFYSSLWISVGISIIIIKIVAEKFHIQGQVDFLQISGYSDPVKRLINPVIK